MLCGCPRPPETPAYGDTDPAPTGETGGSPEPTGETGIPVLTGVLEVAVHPVLGTVVSLSGGTFLMGSAKADPYAQADEFPVHEVTLSGFVIMEREVNQALYANVMGLTPSSLAGCDACPVETVSWDEAVAFASAVSVLTGEAWRLPTEAEWEYAGRGGEGFVYAGSDDVDVVAWTLDNAGGTTHPGCELSANGYGLCDMSGNVWEWVSDWLGPYGSEAVTNPQGPSTGSLRVDHGGSWNNSPASARVANRGYSTPGFRSSYLGFRLARSSP